MVHSQGISNLIYKFLRKDLTTEEADQLQSWIAKAEKNRIFFEEVTKPGYLFAEAQNRDEDDREINMDATWQRLINRHMTAIGQPVTNYPAQPATRRVWYAAAAVVFLFVVGGGYLLLNREPAIKNTAATGKLPPVSSDVLPGINKATLTLANGTVVQLDNTKNGVLTTEGSTAITKRSDGRIVYTKTGNEQTELYNTLTVPRGGQVQLVTLSDGTKVWLNAASSLHYPVAFTGAERTVEINGEAYFEVAHNAAAPFKVTKGKLEIAVLGTHFNVHAYNDEDAIKVTLLEGSVKVVNSDPTATGSTTIDETQPTILKPGEQAVVDPAGDITVNTDFDQEAIMAWKNGLFYFDNTDISVIAHEIERWYDVTVEYDSSLQHAALNGQISRSSNASEVLDNLRTAEVLNYRIHNRKIYLTPYRK